MLEEIIANNLSLIWQILILATYATGLAGVFLLSGKEKLFGVLLLVAGVLLSIGYLNKTPEITTFNPQLDALIGTCYIVGICALFGTFAIIVKGRITTKSAAPLPQIVTESRAAVSQPVGEIPQAHFPREVTVTPPAPYPYLQIFNITWLNIFWMVIVFGLLLILLGLPIIYVACGMVGACSAISVGYYVKKRKYSEKTTFEKPRPVLPTPFELRTCEICMGAIKKGLPIVKCGCGHMYHMSCIKRVAECPFCKEKL